jgi:hypothetical protein
MENHSFRERAELHTLCVCVCVCSLSCQARKAHIRRIILLFAACPAAPYFSTLSYKRTSFVKK